MYVSAVWADRHRLYQRFILIVYFFFMKNLNESMLQALRLCHLAYFVLVQDVGIWASSAWQAALYMRKRKASIHFPLFLFILLYSSFSRSSFKAEGWLTRSEVLSFAVWMCVFKHHYVCVCVAWLKGVQGCTPFLVIQLYFFILYWFYSAVTTWLPVRRNWNLNFHLGKKIRLIAIKVWVTVSGVEIRWAGL